MAFDLHKLIGEDWRTYYSIHTDPTLFQEKLQRIWRRSWLYVAHESEIPHPGDFLSLTLAQQPFLVVRGKDNQVRVLFNICRHRAVTVCREEKGNATHFTCTDHGWVYNTSGGLIGLSGPNCSLRKFAERRGLAPIPRVDMYRGFIFVNLSPEGKTLDEHLGQAKFFIDLALNRSAAGITVAAGRRHYRGKGFWKLRMNRNINHGQVENLGHGHAVLRFPGSSQKCKEPKRSLSQEKAQGILKEGRTLFIFPNLFLVDQAYTSLCVLNPVAPDHTEIITMPFAPKGETIEMTTQEVHHYKTCLGDGDDE